MVFLSFFWIKRPSRILLVGGEAFTGFPIFCIIGDDKKPLVIV